MTANNTSRGPYRLVTVNTAPERAKKLVGRMIDGLKDYDIEHVANCTQIDQVKETVAEHDANVLFCASMWSPEEAQEIQSIARETRPKIKTYALPQGLQVERGPDAVVEHLIEHVPKLLDAPV